MWLSIVRNLVAHSRTEYSNSAISEFRMQLPFQAQEDVALNTPMICNVAWRVLDNSDSDLSELLGLPNRFTELAWMIGLWDRCPVRRSDINRN